MQKKLHYDVTIIGAGAAGLMAAIEAGKRGRKVLILEKNNHIGSKILISGGGRCNFTNINANPNCYISENPHFIKSVFSRYSSNDFIELVEKHNIEYYEKTLGQLFCKKSSREIVNMLQKECNEANVTIKLSLNIQNIKKDNIFTVTTDSGIYTSESLVIACGGLSFPKKGATDFGYKIAKQFEINLIKDRPALVPVTVDERKNSSLLELSGLSFKAEAKTEGTKVTFKENVLITHRGFSGPAILQISSYWQKGKEIELRLEPELSWDEIINSHSRERIELKTLLSNYFSQRLADYLANEISSSKPMIQYSSKEIENIIQRLNAWKINPNGDEGYAKAEVTTGGVDTNELNQKTMESKKIKGLYFIGEIVDVTGWLGGYNFQWAWASGYIAGQNI
jgi:predicted Rossmann fold flavoprotein